MRRSGRACLMLLGALAGTLATAAPAAAEFGPIRLVSRTVPQQATEATQPALGADGRYLALEGTMDEGRTGVFRIGLGDGSVEPVATGAPNEIVNEGQRAENPSISADGRYVAFNTTARLDPADDPNAGTRDVYVADMAASPPTYELASAANGSTQALGGNSQVAPRVALSADGRKVAFVNGGEVYVRDLDTRETTLVSVERDLLTGAMEPGQPVAGGAVMQQIAPGAALSADGTTVAWLGTHLPAQVPLLADEAQKIARIDESSAPYDEPLWRRIADGPLAPTRRIVGGGDPLAPGCPAGGTLADPPCQGPFPDLSDKNTENLNSVVGWLGFRRPDGVPQLSADGRTVALIGNPTEAANLFLVDMASGLSRVQAVRQLTAQIAVNPSNEGKAVTEEQKYVALNGSILDATISPDGRQIAFATARQQFPLAPPNLVTPKPTQLGLSELYLIDLETEALRRVTHGYGGENDPSLGREGAGFDTGVSAVSFGAGDRLIAFSSGASNLVEGDGNEAADVFLVEGESASSKSVASVSSAVSSRRLPKRRRRLVLTAHSLPGGEVELIAVAPLAGRLQARATVSLRVGRRPRYLLSRHHEERANRPARMTLTLPRRFRRLADTQEGLYATLRVTLKPAEGRWLRGKLQIRFHARRRHGGGRR